MIAHRRRSGGGVMNEEEGVRCFIRFKYQQKFRFSLRKYEPFDLDDIWCRVQIRIQILQEWYTRFFYKQLAYKQQYWDVAKN